MTPTPISEHYVKGMNGITFDRHLNVFTRDMRKVRSIMIALSNSLLLNNNPEIKAETEVAAEICGYPLAYGEYNYEREDSFSLDDVADNQDVVLIRNPESRATYEEQQMLIRSLLFKYPGTQFFIATASPLILATVKPENIWTVYEEEDEWYHPDCSYGLNADEVYQLILGLGTTYAPAVHTTIMEIHQLINDQKYDKAEQLIEQFEKETHSAPIVHGLRTELVMERGLQ